MTRERFPLAIAIVLTFGTLSFAVTGSGGTLTCAIYAVFAWTVVAAKEGWADLLLLCLYFWLLVGFLALVGGWK